MVILALLPLGLLIDASDMARVPLGKAFALAPEVLRQTHVGRTWAWRSVFAVVLVAASWWPTRHLLKSMTVLGTMAALVASDSLSSHAIDKGALAVAIYFFHEAAVGVWIGALAGLSLGFATKDLEDGWVERAAPRVSRAAGWCVAVLVPAGVYQAYNALGLNLDHLLYAAYGRTLLLKVALFAVVIGIGGYNRYRVVPEVQTGSSRGALLRNVAVESALLLLRLGVAALLANTPPARGSLQSASDYPSVGAARRLPYDDD
jgi:putative copper export protein